MGRGEGGGGLSLLKFGGEHHDSASITVSLFWEPEKFPLSRTIKEHFKLESGVLRQ